MTPSTIQPSSMDHSEAKEPQRHSGVVYIALGCALILTTLISPPQSPEHGRRLRLVEAPATVTAENYGAAPSAKLSFVKLRVEREDKKAAAEGVIMRDDEGRATPLSWRNEQAAPVLLPDIVAEDDARALSAIRQYAPNDAVVFAFWDLSRRIHALTGRTAPLDAPDPRIFLGGADTAATGFWSRATSPESRAATSRFIAALSGDEAKAAGALTELARGRPVYVCLRLSDLEKAAAIAPELFPIAVRDFPAAGGDHGVIKSVREWIAAEGSAYTVERKGASIRVRYLMRGAHAASTLTRLLPFSSDVFQRLERFELVFQYKDYWIYRLRG